MCNYDIQTLVELEAKLEAVQYRLDHCTNEYETPSKDLLDLWNFYLRRIEEVKAIIAIKHPIC